MKKELIVLLLLVTSISNADDSQCNPYTLANERGFSVYKNDCGGFGDELQCHPTIKSTSEDEVTTQIICSYSGEPDYIDYLNMDITVDLKSCSITREVINNCYSN